MSTILTIFGSLFSMVAVYYINKKLTLWVQAHRNDQNQADVEALRKKTQQDNQAANQASDDLKKIDGR